MKLHLFYVRSNFHLILALGIIEYKQLAPDEIWFVTSRGVKVPAEYALRYFQLDNGENFVYREKYYLQHKADIENMFSGVEVTSYSPYDLMPSSKYFYKNCLFFEEGFSAYGKRNVHIGIKDLFRSISKFLLVWIKFPYASRNAKSFITGQTCLRFSLKKEKDLYVCGKYAYDTVDIRGFHKVEVPVCKIAGGEKYISDSLIIVMDRLNPKGRPFNVEHYLEALKKVLINVRDLYSPVYIKLHPSDNGNEKSMTMVSELMESCELKAELINDNLEDVAVRDGGNTFIGTNSTILFYAPILGKSNQSISFVRILAEKDGQYKNFLELWGGVEGFCRIFSTKVRIMN